MMTLRIHQTREYFTKQNIEDHSTFLTFTPRNLLHFEMSVLEFINKEGSSVLDIYEAIAATQEILLFHLQEKDGEC